MKKNKFLILITFCLSLLFSSCDGMNHIIEEYLERGEIPYIAKPDSMYTVGGLNRIQFKWKLNADPRVEKLVITWTDDDTPDSVTCDIDRSMIDTEGYVSSIINMPDMEGTYIFHVYHTGIEGYPSVPLEVTGNLYGRKYLKSLKPIQYSSIKAYQDKLVINWVYNEDRDISEITYEDSSGISKTIIVEVTELITEIEDYKLGGKIFTKTFYIPEENSIDEFYAEGEFSLPEYITFYKNEWSISDFSSQETIFPQ